MIQLKLTANTPSEQRILEYLQNNASETLAEKINNGTPFEKDGKPLTNKKSLSGFMEYACGEARNLAAKDETAACVEDSVVYGWAIHYFEEDSIEGTLYTLDGSEYIPEKKSAHVSRQTAKTSVVPATTPAVSTPQNKQESLFDMLSSEQPVPEIAPPDEPTPEELQEALEETANEPEPVQEPVTELPKPSNLSPKEVDEETGEILSYEEMKEFDGDITEPPHLSEDLPAPNVTDVENTLLEEEKAFAKAFEPEAVCALADLLGDCFILV